MARPAWAELVVVLVLPAESREDYEPFATRLRSELVAAGFGVRTVRASEPPSASLLEQVAERERGAAAVAVTLSPTAVSGLVWMRDAKAERSLERAVPPEALSGDSPAVFAIRATDVLHGGLLELGYPRPRPPDATEPMPSASASSSAPALAPSAAPPPPEPKPVRPAPPVTAHPKPAPERTWGVGAGTSLLWGPGPGGGVSGLPWAVAPSLAVEKRWSDGLAIDLRVVAPAVRSLDTGPDRSTIDQELGLLGGAWRVPLATAVTLSLDAGGGVYRLGVRGKGRPPTLTDTGRRGQYNAEWSACLFGGAGLALGLGERFSLRLNADAVVPTRRVEVVFVDQAVASSGSPILAVGLGLYASL